MAIDFYFTLYFNETNVVANIFWEHSFLGLDPSNLEVLNSEVDIEEVKKTTFNIKTFKALGLDDWNPFLSPNLNGKH